MTLTSEVGTDESSLKSSFDSSETNVLEVPEEQPQTISPEHEAYPADQNAIDPGQYHTPGLDPEADELADEEEVDPDSDPGISDAEKLSSDLAGRN